MPLVSSLGGLRFASVLFKASLDYSDSKINKTNQNKNVVCRPLGKNVEHWRKKGITGVAGKNWRVNQCVLIYVTF